MAIPPGTRVLVAGPNHAAKVALFRAAAGVWSAGEGRIAAAGRITILFVAERPYLPPGTLREALLRTGREIDTPTSGSSRCCARSASTPWWIAWAGSTSSATGTTCSRSASSSAS